MITEEDFVASSLAAVAPRLDEQTIHVWRLAHRRDRGRAPLLALLAGYLGMDAAAIVLHDDEHGKPRLAVRDRRTQQADIALRFNWSHSGDIALVAVARGVEVGADVERLRPRVRALDLARRFFSPDEAAALAALAPEVRDRAFLHLWCAKEATLKALGRGIAFGLQRVGFAPGREGWTAAQFAAEAGTPGEWHLRDLVPAPGYLGVLAWRGPHRRVEAWRSLAGG